jgi:hypothetical protein
MSKIRQYLFDLKWAMGGNVTSYKFIYAYLRFKELFLDK